MASVCFAPIGKPTAMKRNPSAGVDSSGGENGLAADWAMETFPACTRTRHGSPIRGVVGWPDLAAFDGSFVNPQPARSRPMEQTGTASEIALIIVPSISLPIRLLFRLAAA